MRAIDKLDRLGVEGVRLLLGSGRKDESGDFTKGAGLDAAATEQVIALLNGDGAVRFGDGAEGRRPPDGDGLPGGSRVGGGAAQDAPAQGVPNEGLEELTQNEAFARSAGYGADRIRIDPSVVRGLEHYTGPVFEPELT